MSRRKRTLLAVGLLLMVAMVGILLLFRPPRINEDSFSKIEQGMTLDEIDQIIGAPPGDYSGTGTRFMYVTGKNAKPPPSVQWFGHELCISVWLDERGLVQGKDKSPGIGGPSVVSRIRRWLGL